MKKASAGLSRGFYWFQDRWSGEAAFCFWTAPHFITGQLLAVDGGLGL
jgi:hypothetical protein